ncbi:MAG: hypothetical protein V3T74_04100 [Gemmatimonadales bacterium]
MKCTLWKVTLPAVVVTLSFTSNLSAQPASRGQGVSGTPEQVVRALYGMVTFDPGTTPDWDEVRSVFIDEAVVVLRTSATASTVFSVDGFVQDFVNFIERDNVEATGFVERVVEVESMVFRDIAHVLVLYESTIPGARPPQLGVDSFELIRQDGRWKIVSVINDLPNAGHPVPAVLRN